MIPVFICGYQKSGTTLLASLLDNHPDLMVFPEETSFFRWVNIREFDRVEDRLDFQLTKTHVDRLRAHQGAEVLEGNRDYSDFPFDQWRARVNEYFQKSGKSHKDILLSLIKAFMEISKQEGKRYWIEKTPRNEVYYQAIHRMFPGARYLFIVRDPRDVYCSYRQNRERFSEGRNTLKLGNFLKGWTSSLRMALCIPAASIVCMRYEDLVDDLKSQLGKVVEFLEVPFCESLSVPSKLGIPWQGNSMYGDRFQQVDDRAVGRWRESKWTREIAVIEKLLAPVMKKLGYALEEAERPGYWESLGPTIAGGRKQVLLNLVWLWLNASKISSIKR